MGSIKSYNTTPELIVRSYLHRNGLRFRVHNKTLPGCPDIVLKKYNTVVFVHGCFWHNHNSPACNISHIPKTNSLFWQNKLKANVLRDAANLLLLEKGGWRVLIIWECECKKPIHLKQLVAGITKYRNAGAPSF